MIVQAGCFAAIKQPSGDFGRILAAYGEIFVAVSLLWGWTPDGSARTVST